VDHKASRPSTIIRATVERQDLAPVAIRGVDRVLDGDEAAPHELCSRRSGRRRDFNANTRFFTMFAMSREQDRISQVFGATQPQSIVEAFDRLGFADLHIMVLRRRDGMSGVSGSRQRGEGEGLVAVALLNSEEPDALDGE